MAGEPWHPIERDRRYSSAKKDGLTRLLTEGDSWFDYPPHPNIVDWLEAEGHWAIKRLEFDLEHRLGSPIRSFAISSTLRFGFLSRRLESGQTLGGLDFESQFYFSS